VTTIGILTEPPPPGDNDSAGGGIGDSVDCAVFAPPEVRRGEETLVQVFAFAAGQEHEAHALAEEFDDEAVRRGVTTLAMALRRGQVFQFRLTFHRLELWDPVRRLTWEGRTASVQFAANIPADQPPGNLLGTVLVSADSVPVGRIGFKLKVVARRSRRGRNDPVVASHEAATFRKAYAAYDPKDRAQVLARVQMLRPPLSRLEVFHDTLGLTPGDHRERESYRRIDECDLFLLFWSRNARDSDWVRRELHYAIRRQGPNGEPPPTILPVVIEGPPPPLPPEELAHLHFDDYLLYLMDQGSPVPGQGVPRVNERLRGLQARFHSLAADLNELGKLAGISVPGALNKARFVTEKVLHRLCSRGGVSWGTAEPTLERMIGPLVSAGCIPKSVAIHVRTIQAYASPGSHYQESALTGTHLDIAMQALCAFLDWFPPTDLDRVPPTE
jgi:hypothetical protein